MRGYSADILSAAQTAFCEREYNDGGSDKQQEKSLMVIENSLATVESNEEYVMPVYDATEFDNHLQSYQESVGFEFAGNALPSTQSQQRRLGAPMPSSTAQADI